MDWVDEGNMAMLTDLYELTMANAYLKLGMEEDATFDLFVRKMPKDRGYLISAGLESVLGFIKRMKFGKEHLAYLKENGFDDDFLDWLRKFRFRGEVWAVPEGEVFFADEPILRVTAPIAEAQLLETFLINTVQVQVMIATKAARVVKAARGRPVVDFGLRRAHGSDAGMKAARSSFIGGCVGTSNVLAGKVYGIPIYGTVAHSYIMSHEDEEEAFERWAKTYPDSCVLLIDTYDTVEGAGKAVDVAKRMEKRGAKLRAVRLDSGDLCALSKKVRKILDDNGLNYVRIFASGGLDEYRIDEMLRKGGMFDGFGVGTRMDVSSDAPYIDMNYKLCEYAGEPRMKTSEGKITLPGKKQVRRVIRMGSFVKDIICLEGEECKGEPILVKVMERGRIVRSLPSIGEIRERARRRLSMLPERYKRLRKPSTYPVRLSRGLKALVIKEVGYDPFL